MSRMPVVELRRAKSDKRSIFKWINDRSRRGAIAWLSAYDALLRRLAEQAMSYPVEGIAEFEFEVRVAPFRTRHGRTYQVHFFVEDGQVNVARVRGPGQAPLDADDLL